MKRKTALVVLSVFASAAMAGAFALWPVCPCLEQAAFAQKSSVHKGKVEVKELKRKALTAPLEEAIKNRRSQRSFLQKPIDEESLLAILWAAQGITDKRGLRAAPSAGGTYPLNLYAVTAEGVFRYIPEGEKLERTLGEDRRKALSAACRGQTYPEKAGVTLVFVGVLKRISPRYGERSEKYMNLEAGHSAQNALLAATALGLGGVPIGAFDEKAVANALNLSGDETPLYVIPIGYPKN